MPRITELPDASAVGSEDWLAIVQSNVTKKAAVSLLAALLNGATNPFGSNLVACSSLPGANISAKFRYACDNYTSLGRPVIVLESGITLDAGANNPFVWPQGFNIMCSPTGQDEFGYQGLINLRHTGSNPGAANHGVFKMAAGPSKGQKVTGVAFRGTSSTRPFVDTALDASDGAYWQYVTFTNVSFDQFESIFNVTGTGICWQGVSYLNNFSAARNPLRIHGSDHQIFTNGGFMEMGSVANYATKAALSAMLRFGNTNIVVGNLYPTGSPATPIWVENGNSLTFTDMTLEGRPSPGTVGGDTPTDGLHCAGALVRMTGGRATFKVRHFCYAMRDPRSALLGWQPGGFFDVRNAQATVLGGVFNPYPAGDYPAWTRPDGVAVAADQQPPLAWVSGASARATFSGIMRGSNVSATPVVYAHAGATVIADASVNVVTV